MSRVAGGIDGLEPVFDDGSLVADAGLLLPATVMGRLGLEALIDDTVRLWGRPRRRGAGAQGAVFGGVDACGAGAASTMLTGCGRALGLGCWGSHRRRLRRWGRFCGRSLSGICASSTGSMSWRWGGRGLWALRRR